MIISLGKLVLNDQMHLAYKVFHNVGEKTQCPEELTLSSLAYLEVILSLPYILGSFNLA